MINITTMSTFLDGIGNAVTGGTSNCQIWNTSGSGISDPWCQTVYNKLNLTQSAMAGLGNVGRKFSGQLQKDFGNMPPTVKIPAIIATTATPAANSKRECLPAKVFTLPTRIYRLSKRIPVMRLVSSLRKSSKCSHLTSNC